MSAGDLVATLSLDTSDFIHPLEYAGSHMDEFAGAAVKSMKEVASSTVPANEALEVHKRSWQGFAGESIKATRSATQTFGDVVAPLGAIVRILGIFFPTYEKWGLSLNKIGWAMTGTGIAAQIVGKHYEDNSKAAKNAAAANETLAKSTSQSFQGNAAKSVKAQINEIMSSSSQLAQLLTTSAISSVLLYRSGMDEVIEASGKWLKSDSELMKSAQGVVTALGNIVDNGFTMFGDGVKAAISAILKVNYGFNSIEEATDFAGAALTSFTKTANKALTDFGEAAKEAALVFSAAIALFQSGGTFDAAGYIEEGRQLNALAEQTKATLAAQNAHKNALATINEAFGSAAEKQRIANELTRISTLQSVEAINAEILAMKQAANAADKATISTSAWKKEQSQLAEALGKRKQQLEGGGDKATNNNAVDQQIAAAKQQLLVLKEGETEAAIASAKAKGATDEQVASLRALLEEKNAINSANQVQKQFEQQIADAQKEANRLQDQGIKKIEDLRDKIDEASGAASKYEILQRQLERQGFAEEQIAEMVQLQEEFDKLTAKEKEAKPEDDKKSKTGSNRFAGLGSQEAAKILLSGVGENKLEDLSKGQLLVQKQMLAVFNSTNGILNTMANKEGSDIGG